MFFSWLHECTFTTFSAIFPFFCDYPEYERRMLIKFYHPLSHFIYSVLLCTCNRLDRLWTKIVLLIFYKPLIILGLQNGKVSQHPLYWTENCMDMGGEGFIHHCCTAEWVKPFIFIFHRSFLCAITEYSNFLHHRIIPTMHRKNQMRFMTANEHSSESFLAQYSVRMLHFSSPDGGVISRIKWVLARRTFFDEKFAPDVDSLTVCIKTGWEYSSCRFFPAPCCQATIAFHNQRSKHPVSWAVKSV